MVTTVHDKLKYTLDQVGRYWDVTLQKEATNQDAVANLVLEDGTVIAENLPATFLLGMETKLTQLREVYNAAPTLAPGQAWVLEPNLGKNVFRLEQPEVRAKTAKVPNHKVLVAATDKFPAQIEKWEETINVGTYTKHTFSSCLTVVEKSELLGRVDTLIQAVKKARMRANATAVRDVKVADKLIAFLHPNGF